MENNKTNRVNLAFIELLVLIIAACSVSQCIDCCTNTHQIQSIKKDIHAIVVKDSLQIDSSTVVYKVR